MDDKEFIQNALKTESVVTELNIDAEFLKLAFKCFIDMTEILDGVKKRAFYNNSKKFDTMGPTLDNLILNMKELRWFLHNLNTGAFKHEVDNTINTRVAHGVIGIATESGELVECLYKAMDGGELDTVNLVEELFDGDWYKAVISDELGIDWSKGWEVIISKLKARFGDKFSAESANNRDLKKERDILENG